MHPKDFENPTANILDMHCRIYHTLSSQLDFITLRKPVFPLCITLHQEKNLFHLFIHLHRYSLNTFYISQVPF